MSWGIRVIILTVGFAAFMSFLVYKSMQQQFDLVAEDYYSQELAFQDQINKQTNQQQSGIAITLKAAEEDVILSFPDVPSDRSVVGSITFFRPSDSHKDVKVEIALHNGQQALSKQKFSTGL